MSISPMAQKIEELYPELFDFSHWGKEYSIPPPQGERLENLKEVMGVLIYLKMINEKQKGNKNEPISSPHL